MIKGILGKKLGMTQLFANDGRRIPVTVVEAGPCTVVQKKTVASDGYSALQLGFIAKPAHRVNKPELGHFKKAGQGAFQYLRELRGEGLDEINIGDEIRLDNIFVAGDVIDVTATSKGKGFQGVIKRWNFSGGRATHGSMFHRAPGSIGASAWPSRVFKGKKMAGQMGNEQVTVQNLQIVEVRPEENLILVRGAIPGAKNALVVLHKGIKVKQ
ncbi:50S ribosomal protein L3 [Desulfuromonas carbonis]|uniref:50S ribosomal protein L3 n=1 Tax=Desulfuromonas sp. DDH964 TaxID=1823759 RepID=UPI00078D8D24|nr:50S ribosomal protein L3 [Desulfuromonas sp. DDH964]AMV71491.1 50S ribosomal protein L3 [Desulfuromonas sp. DDH964]